MNQGSEQDAKQLLKVGGVKIGNHISCGGNYYK